MSYLEILSPYSGDPVKVRQVDVGRAVKDREGRVFYVLLRSDGQGHYGSLTRKGGPREESQYLQLESRIGQARAQGQESSQEQLAEARSRFAFPPGLGNFIRLILFLAILLAGGFLLWLKFGQPQP